MERKTRLTNAFICRAIAALVEHQRDSLCTLELDGAELTDRSVELIATCPLLSKLTVSFAELLTGRSLKHIGVLLKNLNVFFIWLESFA